MKITAYLIVGLETDYYGRPKAGQMRVVKNKPDLINTRELGFQLNLEIPDVYFKRLVPVVDVELPEDMLINPNPKIVVGITAGKVAEAMGLKVEKVRDGLMEMLEEQQKNAPKV